MKKKILIFILILVVVYSLGGIVYLYLNKEDKQVIKKVDEIDKYGYALKNTASNYYKEEFDNLKQILNQDNVNNEEYAKSISKLFIIDLYTLNNKINKYDTPGEEFIYPEALDNYKIKLEDTMYKYLEDNSLNERTKKLPEVSLVNIDNIKEDKYKINDKEYDSYNVDLSWDYINDLGYNKKASLILAMIDNKLYICEINNEA